MYKKRLISWLLAVVMLLGMMPASVMGETTGTFTDTAKVVLAGADVVGNELMDHEIEVLFRSAGSKEPLQVVNLGAELRTESTSITVEELLENLTVDQGSSGTSMVSLSALGGRGFKYAALLGGSDTDETPVSNGYVLDNTVTRVALYYDGHTLSLDSVENGTATLLAAGVELTQGESALVNGGTSVSVDAAAAEGFEAEPVILVNGETAGNPFLMPEGDASVTVKFTAKTPEVVNPKLTWTVEGGSFTVKANNQAISSGDEVEAGLMVSISGFTADLTHSTTGLTVTLNGKALTANADGSFSFMMPDADASFAVMFGDRAPSVAGQVYYVASADNGGNSFNSGLTYDKPLLSVTEAIEKAKAAGSDTVEIYLVSSIVETQNRVFNSSNLGSVRFITIDGQVNGSKSAEWKYGGQQQVGTSGAFLSVDDGVQLTLRNLTVTRQDNDYMGRLVMANRYDTVINMSNVSLVNGKVGSSDAYLGGAGLLVTNFATVNMDQACTVRANTSFGDNKLAGAVLVDKNGTLNIYGAKFGGSANVDKNTVTDDNGVRKVNAGDDIYVKAEGTLHIYTSGELISIQDRIFLEPGCKATVGADEDVSAQLQLGNVYLADNASRPLAEATLDILGETDDADINIEVSDEYHYAYRLISRQEPGYVIDNDRLNGDAGIDEDGWEDLDGKWDIRYLNYYKDGEYVPGLYFVYFTIDAQFHDVRTVDVINGKTIAGHKLDTSAPDAADIEYYPGLKAPNSYLIPAKDTGDTDPVTGLKGEEYLYVPEIVPVGGPYYKAPGNSDDRIDTIADYVVTFGVDENYRLPLGVVVTLISCDGHQDDRALSSDEYTYEPDFESGTAVLTVKHEVLEAAEPGDILDVKLTAERYYELNIEMNGPLYTMTASREDLTVKAPLSVSTASINENDKLVSYTVYEGVEGTDSYKPRDGVTVALYLEGTSPGELDSSRVLATDVTGPTESNPDRAPGEVVFKIGDETFLNGEHLNSGMSFYCVLYYTDTYRVVYSDNLYLTLTTMEGQRMRTPPAGLPCEADSAKIDMSISVNNDAKGGSSQLSETRGGTTVSYYSDVSRDIIKFVRNEPEGCTTVDTAEWCVNPTSSNPVWTADNTGYRVKKLEAASETYGNLYAMRMVGYTFKGWATTPDASAPNVFSNTPYRAQTSATTLYAVWTPNTVDYTIQHWVEYVAATVDHAGSATSGEIQGRNPYYVAGETPVLAKSKDGSGDYVQYANSSLVPERYEIAYYLWCAPVKHTGIADEVKPSVIGNQLDDLVWTDAGNDRSWWSKAGFTVTADEECKILADGTAVYNVYYTRNVYTITYDAAPGTLKELGKTTSHKFGDILCYVAEAQRSGYDFSTWYHTISAEDGVESVTYTSIYTWAEDINVWASWTPRSDTRYTIRIMTQDIETDFDTGKQHVVDTYTWFLNVSENLTGISDDAQTNPQRFLVSDNAALVVPGFTYMGYNSFKDSLTDGFVSNNREYEVSPAGTGDTIVYLYYQRNLGTVTFEGKVLENGAVREDATIKFRDVTEIIPFHSQFGPYFPDPAPTRAGYDFKGWQDANGVPVNADTWSDRYLSDSSLTFSLYPIWEARTGGMYDNYYLTYMVGEGATLDPSNIVLSGTPLNGSDLTPNPVTPGGYRLGLTLTYDQDIGYMPHAFKAGYDFVGWFLDEECTQPLVYVDSTEGSPFMRPSDGYVSIKADISNVFVQNENNAVEETRPVFAKFRPHTHTLVLDAVDGTVAAGNGWTAVTGTDNHQVSKTMTFDELIGTMPVPEKTGYTFVGWFLDIQDAGGTRLTEDMVWNRLETDGAKLTATAMYVPNQYKYRLHLNDVDAGNGSTKAVLADPTIVNVEIYFDSTYATVLGNVVAQRNGYTFLGWSLTPYNCESLMKDAKIELLDLTAVNKLAEEADLYAVWRPNVYEMRVYLNGGQIQYESETEDQFDAEFNWNSYAAKYYGEMGIQSYSSIYGQLDASIMPLQSVAGDGYWSVPVVFDTVYGDLPVLTRDGSEGERYVFGGYLASSPAWRTMLNGESVKVIDGRIVKALDASTLPLTNGLYTNLQDEYLRLDALWEAQIHFNADLAVNGSDVIIDANGDGIDDAVDGVYTVLKSNLSSLPVAVKPGFTFLGWFDEAGTQYTLGAMQAENQYKEFFARFTPTVTFKPDYEDGQGYITVNGVKYGEYSIGLSQLFARFSQLPTAYHNGDKLFMGWYAANKDYDVSTLENLRGLTGPITLYADFEYAVRFSLPSNAHWGTQGMTGTQTIAVKDLTQAKFNSLKAQMEGCTFVGWHLTTAPYTEMSFSQLSDPTANRSYSVMAAFQSGGSNPGGDQTETEINVTVMDYTKGAMTLTKPEKWVDGENSFTVSCDKVCAVALIRGGNVTALKCEAGENGYVFTEQLQDGDAIAVVMVGDINLNGDVNASDYPLLAQYVFGHTELDKIQLLVADINGNGDVNASDYPMLAQYVFGHTEFSWNLK